MTGIIKDSTRRAKRSLAQRAWRREQHERSRAPSAPETPSGMLEAWQVSPGLFIEECLHVPDINGGKLVPFHLNTPQRIVIDILEAELAAQRPEGVQLAILKSRRATISSLCQAVGYWKTSLFSYSAGLVLAYKQDATEEVFERGIKQFYLSDERQHVGLRPDTESSNRRELKFGNPNARARTRSPGLQSVLRVSSADADQPGRGLTLQFVHGSEVPYWPDKPVWSGVGIARSKAPDSIAILEGTANGQGGFFHDTYTHGANPAPYHPLIRQTPKPGANGWISIFLPWYIDERNTRVLTEEERERWAWRNRAESELAERYHLSLEQMAWRRSKIASPECFQPGVQREDKFRQEWPSDEDEAFLSTGKHFFLLSGVKELEEDPEKGARQPRFMGSVRNDGPSLEERGPHNRFPVKALLEENPDGFVAVWREPDPNEDYLLVVDPSEGISGRDEAAVGALARSRMEFDALLRTTSLSSRELAQNAALLGWAYGGAFGCALTVIEHNAIGVAVINEFLRLCYPRLWQYQDPSKPGAEPSEKVGYITTDTSRMYALRLLEAVIRTKEIGLHDEEFFKQCRNFVWPDHLTAAGHAKPQARPGHHDDIVMMAAIGVTVAQQAGIVRRKASPPLEPDTREPLVPERMQGSFSSQRSIRRRELSRRGAMRYSR